MIKRQTEIVYKIRDMMKIGEEIKKRRTEENKRRIQSNVGRKNKRRYTYNKEQSKHKIKLGKKNNKFIYFF